MYGDAHTLMTTLWLEYRCQCTMGTPGRDNGDPGPHSTGKMGTRGPQKHREYGDPLVKMGTPPTGNSIRERWTSVAVWNSSMP